MNDEISDIRSEIEKINEENKKMKTEIYFLRNNVRDQQQKIIKSICAKDKDSELCK